MKVLVVIPDFTFKNKLSRLIMQFDKIIQTVCVVSGLNMLEIALSYFPSTITIYENISLPNGIQTN